MYFKIYILKFKVNQMCWEFRTPTWSQRQTTALNVPVGWAFNTTVLPSAWEQTKNSCLISPHYKDLTALYDLFNFS